METTSLLCAMADGEGAGGLNLSPSILYDYRRTLAAGSEEGRKKGFDSPRIDELAQPLTQRAL